MARVTSNPTAAPDNRPCMLDLYTSDDGVVYVLVEVQERRHKGPNKRLYSAVAATADCLWKCVTDDISDAVAGLSRLPSGSSVTITQE